MLKYISISLLLLLGITKLFSQTVFVNPYLSEVHSGEIFSTSVEISNVENLGSFEININFDSDIIHVESLELGSFLGSTGRTIFPLLELINNESGFIEYAVTTLGSEIPGPDGDGILLNISWRVSNEIDYETQTEINLSNIQLTEPDGTYIDAETNDGIVLINSLAITNIYDYSISLFPNPTNGVIWLKTPQKIKSENLTIYTTTALSVDYSFEPISNAYQIQIQEKPGLYFLRIQIKNEFKVLPFIVD